MDNTQQTCTPDTQILSSPPPAADKVKPAAPPENNLDTAEQHHLLP